MKTLSKVALIERNRQLESENDILSLALTDAVNGSVKWFGHSRTFQVGISRATGAAGGIAIIRESGMVSAAYFERWSRERLAHVACCITGENTDRNIELARIRSTIEAAQAFITSCYYPASPTPAAMADCAI